LGIRKAFMEREQFGNGLCKVGTFLVVEREKMVTPLHRRKNTWHNQPWNLFRCRESSG